MAKARFAPIFCSRSLQFLIEPLNNHGFVDPDIVTFTVRSSVTNDESEKSSPQPTASKHSITGFATSSGTVSDV